MHPNAGNGADTDYHRQYDQTAFLDALARTRTRQGEVLVELIRRHAPRAQSLVDYGSGRGFFLEAARRAGFAELAGMDTSSFAIELLRERGMEGVLLSATDSGKEPPRASFQPQVLTLLDVIEHFPAERVVTDVRALLDALRPGLVLIKVPSSAGVLYGAARALAVSGRTGPIEQLYQVGSHPPHFSYFSRASLRRLIQDSGLELLELAADLEFEPSELGRRAASLRWLGPAASLLGRFAALTAEQLGRQDSLIAVARFSAPAPARCLAG